MSGRVPIRKRLSRLRARFYGWFGGDSRRGRGWPVMRHQGMPWLLVEELRKTARLAHAVESGTYRGSTAQSLGSIFESVTTIELSPALARLAGQRLEAMEHVHVRQGSSREALPEIVRDLPGPALYWLDAHWSGDETVGEDEECPLLEEIRAIDAEPISANSVILIDDARLFMGPPPPPHKREAWPTIAQVVDALREIHDRYIAILEDVVVAVPPELQEVVDTYWRDQQKASLPRWS